MTASHSLRVRRRPWVLALAQRYARRRLSKSFDGMFVHGLQEVRRLALSQPLILAANHVCWWDAFAVVMLDQALRTESYCLMDAANLAQLPFFAWIGAIPLERRSPRQSLRDLRASTTLLDRPGRALWIFPQGEHRPAHLRPLGLKRGVELLVREQSVKVVPVAINYLWRQAPAPTLAVSLGAPLSDRADTSLTDDLHTSLVAGLRRIDDFALGDVTGFEPLIAARAPAKLPLGGRLIAALAARID